MIKSFLFLFFKKEVLSFLFQTENQREYTA